MDFSQFSDFAYEMALIPSVIAPNHHATLKQEFLYEMMHFAATESQS